MKFFLVRRITLTVILLVCSKLFPQEAGTISNDTAKVNDSSFVIPDSLSYDTTQVSVKDSLVKVDTLYPLYQVPFYNYSFFISRETIDILDYRYTGNLFIPAAFSFLKDKGMIGQPNELILYGNGFGRTGFFSDGILYTNRYTSALDLNLIQNELTDSIEILPLPRGFLYGPDNYIAAVNFIERDLITPAPYTRIKYYEGPEGEAFVDGIFNTSFLNMFNFSLDASNRNFDGIYDNSDFSIWQADFKLKYFPSNSINLIGSYSLVSSDLGYFGGVDADSISRITNEINSILYNPLFAPVIYPTLRQESKWDKFKLRALGRFGNLRTDLNFYYHAETEKYSGAPLNNEIKNYILGTSLRQSYSESIIRLELNGVFEKRELNYYYSDTTSGFQSNETDYKIFSLSPVLSLYLLDSAVVPSVYYKYSNVLDLNLGSHSGIGTDVSFNLFRSLNLYLGFGRFDFLNRYETDVYEAGANIKLKNFYADIKYYGTNISLPPYMPSPGRKYPFLTESNIKKITSYSASLNFDFWRIGLEGRFSFINYDERNVLTSSEIKMHAHSGIFYKDILFNSNLDLKTGFVLKYYDFESENFESAYQVDFTIAGIIQKVAIVYFSWENLFDKQYFIVPYYPMRERGIRFGLAWEMFN
jgi:hypothetical protein